MEPYSCIYHTHFRGTICPQYDKRLNPAVTAHMEPSSGSSASPGLSSLENQEENKRGNEQSKDKGEKKAC